MLKKNIKNTQNNKDEIINISKCDNIESIKKEISNNQIGLTNKESDEFIEKFGKNELSEKKNKLIKDILKEVFSPFNFLLFFIAIFNLGRYLYIIFLSKDKNTAIEYLIGSIIILIMIILSTTTSLIIEYKTDSVNNELKDLIKNNVHVIRGVSISKNIKKEEYSKLISKIQSVESSDIAIGELIHLSAGDVIPANIRVIYEHHLLVDESSISGESEHVIKSCNNDVFEDLTLKNICYAGSSVVSGFALGVVFQRLNNSLISDIASKNEEIQEKRESSFKQTLNMIVKIIISFVAITTLVIFFLKPMLNDPKDINNWLNSIVFSIAIAVGLIPESLPVIISANLSRGSKLMANKKMLVRNGSAVQDIGLIDILCTDKTGTLTNNEIALNSHLAIADIDNNLSLKENDDIFKLAFYNSHFQTSLVNNSIDNAILKHDDLISDLNQKIKVDEIPFNFKRRVLSVVIKDKKDRKLKIISKGAFEEILKISNSYIIDGEVKLLTQDIKEKITNMIKELNNKERVVAIGYKDIEDQKELFNKEDESNIILAGFLSFSDTPKSGVKEAINSIQDYGVGLKIISGDNEKVTSSICKKINLSIDGVLNGSQLEKLTQEEKVDKIEKCNVFVKISPNQKSEIVEILQKKHKIGFLGDGINDAMALKQSDIAISVDNASEIAKSASDLILLQKNLQVIKDGLIQGRSTYENISKFIKITLVNKFSLMLIFIISSVLFKNSFLTPFQILLMDLILDFVQMVFILDTVNLETTKKINKIDLKRYYKFVLFNAPFLVISTITNFMVLKYVFNCSPTNDLNDPNTMAFHAACFTQISINSILSIYLLRERICILSRKYKVQMIINAFIALIMTIILVLPYFPFINVWLNLKIEENTLKQWFGYWYLSLLAILMFYIFIQELGKIIYQKIFKEW